MILVTTAMAITLGATPVDGVSSAEELLQSMFDHYRASSNLHAKVVYSDDEEMLFPNKSPVVYEIALARPQRFLLRSSPTILERVSIASNNSQLLVSLRLAPDKSQHWIRPPLSGLAQLAQVPEYPLTPSSGVELELLLPLLDADRTFDDWRKQFRAIRDLGIHQFGPTQVRRIALVESAWPMGVSGTTEFWINTDGPPWLRRVFIGTDGTASLIGDGMVAQPKPSQVGMAVLELEWSDAELPGDYFRLSLHPDSRHAAEWDEWIVVPPTEPAEPQITLHDLDKKSWTLQELAQQYDLLVLDFWASWCAPCVRSLPHVHTLVTEAGAASKVGFYGVNLQEEPDRIRNAIERFQFSFPVLVDQIGASIETLGVEAIPHIVIIDHHGRVRARHNGSLTDQGTMRFREILDMLLREAVVGSRDSCNDDA